MADKKCSRCNGSGLEQNDKLIGRTMRGYRLSKKIGLREMAGRIGVSAGFLTNLEKGNRRWSPDIISNFHAGLKMATKVAKVSSKHQQR